MMGLNRFSGAGLAALIIALGAAGPVLGQSAPTARSVPQASTPTSATPTPDARPMTQAEFEKLDATRRGIARGKIALPKREIARALKPAPLVLMVPKLSPVLKVDAQMVAFSAAMKGWTPVTEGATGGGPELTRIGGQLFMLVAASDGAVHSVQINPGQLAPIKDSWTRVGASATNVPARGDIACQAEIDGAAARCATLTTDGAAATFGVINNGGRLAPIGSDIMVNAGGKNAGARPGVPGQFRLGNRLDSATACAADQAACKTVNGAEFQYPLLVWDGAESAFSDFGLRKDFQKLKFAYRSGFGCDVDCAFLRFDNKISFLSHYWFNRASWFPSLIESYGFHSLVDGTETGAPTGIIKTIKAFRTEKTTVPALAGGRPQLDYVLGQNTEWVVQVGDDGALYANASTTGSFGNGWYKLGGWVKPGTFPACTAVNGSLTCAIQALDGRIYIKGGAASQGL
jgi:hypothetical protein